MSIDAFFNQEVTHYPSTGVDKYGRETDGTAETLLARFQTTSRSKLAANNQVVTIDALCFVGPDSDVDIDDRIDYGGIIYRVTGVYGAVDGDGATHHKKLELSISPS
jgi:hypothetical protein